MFFLGYPQGIKGYKFLDLESNSIYISRDVVFYEHIFPYATFDHTSTSYLDSFVFPRCTLHETTIPIISSIPSSHTIDSTLVPSSSIPVPISLDTPHASAETPPPFFCKFYITYF